MSFRLPCFHDIPASHWAPAVGRYLGHWKWWLPQLGCEEDRMSNRAVIDALGREEGSLGGGEGWHGFELASWLRDARDIRSRFGGSARNFMYSSLLLLRVARLRSLLRRLPLYQHPRHYTIYMEGTKTYLWPRRLQCGKHCVSRA